MTVSPLWLCRCVQLVAAVALAGAACWRLLTRGTDLMPIRTTPLLSPGRGGRPQPGARAPGRCPRRCQPRQGRKKTRDDDSDRHFGQSGAWNRLALGSWGALTAASALQLGLTAAAMSGLPFTQAISGDVLGQVLGGTSYGAVWRVQMCLLAGVLVWLGLGPAIARLREPVPTGLNVAGAVLSAALLASLVWTGHAASLSSRAWLWPVMLVHVVAAGAWPGGLLPLALMLARARHDPRLVPAAMTVTRRFSRLSVVAVMTLAASGLANASGLIGWSSAGWSGPYGRLVWCKLALFAAMVALGAANRRLLRPPGPVEQAWTIRRLGRHVALECVLAAFVLAASAALAMIAPPAQITPL